MAIWSNNWRGDRLAYSRQFVSAAQQELAVRLIVPVQPLDLGARLVATAQHVGQAAQFELFGGFQGRRIQAQTNALTMACQNLRQALARQFPEAKWNAMIEAEASYEAMQESMRGQQFAAPRTSQHLGNLGQLLQEARRTLPGVGGPDSALRSNLGAEAGTRPPSKAISRPRFPPALAATWLR